MGNDIGAALHAALAAKWAQDDMAHKEMEGLPKRKHFEVTNNLSRASFETAQKHPATKADLLNRLEAMGYKRGSACALLGQMIRQGILQADDEGVLHLTVSEYTPVKSSKAFKNLQQKKAVAKRKAVITLDRSGDRVRATMRREEQGEEKRPVSVSSAWSVRDVLAGLSVLHARELFDELKKIFGETK